MTSAREEFLSQESPEIMEALREKAHKEGRDFQDVLDDATIAYVASKKEEELHREAMTHFRESLKKHRRLGELLGKS